MVATTQAVATVDLLRWMPLIPLLASLINMFFGTRLGRKTAGGLACAAVLASFAIALYVFWLLPATGMFRDTVYTWIESGSFQVKLSFQVDALTAVMLLVVTGIGFLIHIYSLGYMGHDEGMVRFFVYLNLFIFFMLLLVMGDNLLVLFIGWEGVGLCSYLLIGFWYHDHANTIAGNKAFIVNRIGDFGFMLGLLLLVTELGRQGVWTLDFMELQKHVEPIEPGQNYADHFAAVCRRRRKVGTNSALCLAAGCHGRTDAGERAHPCGDHGYGRRLYDRAAPFPLRLGAGDLVIDRDHRRSNGLFRRHCGADAKRHQARLGLFHGEPAWLHVCRRRHRSIQCGDLSSFYPCVFQGVSFPGIRQRDSRPRTANRICARWAVSRPIYRRPIGLM